MNAFQNMIYAEESKNRTLIQNIEGTDVVIYMKQLIDVCEKHPDAMILLHYLDDIQSESLPKCNSIDMENHNPMIIHPIKSIIYNSNEIILTPLTHDEFAKLDINFLDLDTGHGMGLTAASILDTKPKPKLTHGINR